jgi:hypothetical protein
MRAAWKADALEENVGTSIIIFHTDSDAGCDIVL